MFFGEIVTLSVVNVGRFLPGIPQGFNIGLLERWESLIRRFFRGEGESPEVTQGFDLKPRGYFCGKSGINVAWKFLLREEEWSRIPQGFYVRNL